MSIGFDNKIPKSTACYLSAQPYVVGFDKLCG